MKCIYTERRISCRLYVCFNQMFVCCVCFLFMLDSFIDRQHKQKLIRNKHFVLVRCTLRLTLCTTLSLPTSYTFSPCSQSKCSRILFFCFLFYFHGVVSFCRVVRIAAHRLFILIKLSISSESQRLRVVSSPIRSQHQVGICYRYLNIHSDKFDSTRRKRLVHKFSSSHLFRFTSASCRRPPFRTLQVCLSGGIVCCDLWHLSKIYSDRSQQSRFSYLLTDKRKLPNTNCIYMRCTSVCGDNDGTS